MSSRPGFTAVGTVSLSVTSTTGRVALAGNGDRCIVQNAGSKTAYIATPGGATVAATTSDTPLRAGAAIILNQQSATYVAAICGGSDTTTLTITSGSGDSELSLSAEVDISSLVVTAISEAQANAAAPSWVEGTNNPISQNLTGDQRVIAKIASAQTLATVTTVGTVTTITNAVNTNADAAIAAGTAPSKALVAGAVYNSSAPSPTTGQSLAAQADASGRLLNRNSPASTGTMASVASSGSSVTVLAANAARIGAAVYNDSTQVLYLLLSTGGTASTTVYTVQMAAASYYEVPAFYTGALIGIWASANGNARVTEFAV